MENTAGKPSRLHQSATNPVLVSGRGVEVLRQLRVWVRHQKSGVERGSDWLGERFGGREPGRLWLLLLTRRLECMSRNMAR